MAQDKNLKTRICKYCKSEIPADAKICPHCRKKQDGGKLKWIIIAVVLLIIIAAAASSGDEKPKKVSSASDKASSESSASAASSETGSESVSAETDGGDETFTIGDTVEFDGVQVELASAILSEGDGEFVKPDDGKYFLALVFNIDNQSSNDIDISSYVSFEAYCDDYSLNQDLMGQQIPEVDGMESLDGSVAAGKRMNGVICYQVPQDFENFEISCTPDFWKNNKCVFEFTRDEVDASGLDQE